MHSMSCNGLGKVVDDLTILESQRLDNRKHAFDKAARCRRLDLNALANRVYREPSSYLLRWKQ